MRLRTILVHATAFTTCAALIGAADVADEAVSESLYQSARNGLSPAELATFAEGRKGFAQRWVVAPSILGLWGRGPTSNGEACTDCHQNGGRGHPSDDEREPLSMLVRLSIPGIGPHNGPLGDPNYGDQLQEQGILGRVPAEGQARILWHEFIITLPDGERVALRRPQLELRALAFGPLAANVMTSARVAPPLIGAGLIDAVSEAAILEQERRQPERGLHGHANRVWDVVNAREVLGRFGRKANQPHLLQQVITAYHADLGVTSQWFPQENCPETQVRCRAEPPGGHPELPPAFLEPVLFFLRMVAPPTQRTPLDDQARRGEALFDSAGCSACHVSQWQTAGAAQQRFSPYTDLLVHDMGPELADGRPDFTAGAREWRTTPLWGLGLSAAVNGNTELLHDGRARTLLEAILWHGGEAQSARSRFEHMSATERAALIAFVQTL